MPDKPSFTTRSRTAQRNDEITWGDDESPSEDEIDVLDQASVENGVVKVKRTHAIETAETLSAGNHEYNNLLVDSGVTITAQGDYQTDENGEYGGVKIVASGDITIQGTIDARGQGYPARYTGPGTPQDQQYSSGAGYGGLGGGTYEWETSGYTYGASDVANRLGSGSSSAAGGGSVWLVAGGDIIVNGTILADGLDADHHGPSGGSIRLEADGEIRGDGTVSATGGSVSDDQYSGGGGGGRILFLGTDNSTITADVSGGVQSASGYDAGESGEDGTIVR